VGLTEERDVPALLVFALVVLLLFGAGAAIHVLWVLAIIAALVWLIGFLLRPASGRGRWYYW
jgi:hypothetical protein